MVASKEPRPEAVPESSGLKARLDLASSAFRLKDEERQGWVLRGVLAPESVADHSWGTALLCRLFAGDAGVDSGRAVAIALLHDLAEAVTGDVVARVATDDRQVSIEEKADLEVAAMADLLAPGGSELEEIMRLWSAYEHRSDPAARFVRDMNLIDMCLQAVLYERQRRYDFRVIVASQGGYTHLDEFFVSAERRLDSPVAKDLFELIRSEYESVRRSTEAHG